MAKQQNQSKQQANQAKQGQGAQPQKQKQSSTQASMNEYGTMTAKQDANADYASPADIAGATSAATGADSAALDKKAKKFAENQNNSLT